MRGNTEASNLLAMCPLVSGLTRTAQSLTVSVPATLLQGCKAVNKYCAGGKVYA
jgi:hypothetical protein